MALQSWLEDFVCQLLEEQGVKVSHPQSGVLSIHLPAEIRQCNLYNLQLEIQRYPMFKEQLARRFVEQILGTTNTTLSLIYPRLLPHETHRHIGYPWVESLMETQLDVALVEHHLGVLRFLSPFDVIQQGGLQRLKMNAVHNMTAFIHDLQWDFIDRGVCVSTHAEVLTSSALLCLSAIPSLPMDAHQVLYCAIPSRGVLWMGSNRLYDFQTQIYHQYQTEAHPICPEIIPWTIAMSDAWLQSWSGQCKV